MGASVAVAKARDAAGPCMGPSADLLGRSNLTQSQLLIWAGQQLSPDVPVYNMPLAFSIEGELDAELFERAFQTLVDRSDALRTVVEEVDGAPRQRTLPEMKVAMEAVDLGDADDPEGALEGWLESRRQRPFAAGGPLFDTALVRLGPARFVWYFNQHHIVTDASSSAIIYRRTAEIYDRLLKGQTPELDELPAYRDYLEHEARFRDSRPFAAAREYWEQKLTERGAPAKLYGREAGEQATRAPRLSSDLGLDRSRALRALGERSELRMITPELSQFSFFATLLFAFLYLTSGNRRLTIGVPFHNRPTRAFKETIGMFIELYPLRVEIEDDETFLSLLRKVQSETFDCLQHAQPGTSSAEGHRSFNVVLNCIRASFPDFCGLETRARWVHSGHVDSHHSLRLEVHDFDESGSIQLDFDCNGSVFDEVLQGRAVEHFGRMVDAFLDDRERALDDVDLVTAAERKLLLAEWNDPSLAPACDDTIVDLFERQAERTADALAVVYGDQRLTYGELNERANHLARYLSSCGVATDSVVSLYLDRSVEMIVAMLGVLKAGAAYAPLDPALPPSRIGEMLRDTRSRVVLTQQRLIDELASREAQVVALDSDWPSIVAAPSAQPERPRASNLAYVLYTSGSTGSPKAVMIEHRNVVSLVKGLHERVYPGRDEALRVAMVAPYGFDPSVQQIFAALLGGHSLHIVPDEARFDPAMLREFLVNNGIDISDGAPAHLRLLAGAETGGSIGVKRLIIGGERLSRQLVAQFLERYSADPPRITNIYGPAECCVDSVLFEVANDDLPDGDGIPIGRPMPNEQVYVLSSRGRLQPPGAPGELCIAGAGVGRGYWGDEALSAEKFVENRFGPGKLYRTGDVARHRADGNLEFLGRLDRQVQIRGFRIELGEIEQRLKQYRKQRTLPAAKRGAAKRCARCLLSDGYPGIEFDDEGVCRICREFEAHRPSVEQYFRPFEEFEQLTARAGASRQGDYDCLLLYSGGKDSSYVLHRLVEMGLKVLAFTFDNGFISQAAFRNIERQTSQLNVDSVVETTQRMNDIFVESLNSDQTVCTGCFKSLTSISTRLAHEKRIPVVITGLSRGQIYDTKLEGLIAEGVRDVAAIEDQLRLFREVYHANQDRTAQLLDVDLSAIEFRDFEFVDFFRYDQTPVSRIKEYLAEKDSYWRQPKDTGFCSSNCMMNDVGICVHSSEAGYHNYEAPLSWDVRLGIIEHADGLAEVEHEVDVRRVTKTLGKIGYFESYVRDAVVVDREDAEGGASLCAYYTANQKLSPSELREHLSRTLPAYMIPAAFVEIPEIPLTHNGKLDRKALPAPDSQRQEPSENYRAPQTPAETLLAKIWEEALGVTPVGVHDNFFALGGDSILNMQIVNRANQAGLRLRPNQVFRDQTIRELAANGGREADGAEDLCAAPRGETSDFPGVDPAELESIMAEFGEPAGD